MTGESIHNLELEDRQELVELLLACNATMKFWDGIMADLSHEVRVGVEEGGTPKIRVSNLLATSLGYPGGIERLLRAVRGKAHPSQAWLGLAQTSFRLLCRISLERESLANRLVAIVEELNPSRDVIRTLGAHHADGRRFASAYDAILILFQRPVYSHAETFLRALADVLESEKLRGWLGEAAGAFGFSSTSAGIPAEVEENYLMIQIQLVAAGKYKVYSWGMNREGVFLLSLDPDKPIAIDALAEEIEDVASRMRNLVGRRFIVELFVGRSSFGEDVARFRMRIGAGASTLVCEAPIAFRCLERLEARRLEDKERQRGLSETQARLEAYKRVRKNFINLVDWKEKSARLRARAEADARSLLEHLAEADVCSPAEQQALADALCVSLGSVPPEKGGGQDALSVAIDLGAPIAIWFRELAPDQSIDKPALLRHLRLDQDAVALRELRRHLWALRREAVAMGACDEPCHHLTMMYDEYDRIPPEPVSQPPEIQERRDDRE